MAAISSIIMGVAALAAASYMRDNQPNMAPPAQPQAAASGASNSPLADQAKADAESASKGMQEKSATRRRLKAASLLATSGQGDLTAPVTGSPSAKPTLGA